MTAFTLRTHELLEQALSDLAEQEGASKQEIIRRAVPERDGRPAHERGVDEAAGRMVDRWGDVPDRLGSA